MSTINPSQDFDIISTCTFDSPSWNCKIKLHKWSYDFYSSTIYYREWVSGSWTSLSVSGDSTTFPVTGTTMQIGHNWNNDQDDYMTHSFNEQRTNLTKLSISLKQPLTWVIGNFFMCEYAKNCEALTTLWTIYFGLVSEIWDFFMYEYAYGCKHLTQINMYDFSNLLIVGNYFLQNFVFDCYDLQDLWVFNMKNLVQAWNSFMSGFAAYSGIYDLWAPDMSNLKSVWDNFMFAYANNSDVHLLSIPNLNSLEYCWSDFMAYYARYCHNLTSLSAPKLSNLKTCWSNFMESYARGSSWLLSLIAPDLSKLEMVGVNFMQTYAYDCIGLLSISIPNMESLWSIESNFMDNYAGNCDALEKIFLTSPLIFSMYNISWNNPFPYWSLKWIVLNSADLTVWKYLAENDWRTLFMNFIQSASLVTLAEIKEVRLNWIVLSNGSWLTSNTITTSVNRTFKLSDAGKIIKVDSGWPVTLTIPAHNVVTFPIWTIIYIERWWSWSVTITWVGPVTINSVNSNKDIADRYGRAYIRKDATNTWILVWELA